MSRRLTSDTCLFGKCKSACDWSIEANPKRSLVDFFDSSCCNLTLVYHGFVSDPRGRVQHSNLQKFNNDAANDVNKFWSARISRASFWWNTNRPKWSNIWRQWWIQDFRCHFSSCWNIIILYHLSLYKCQWN